ncbi:unnamed protein product [Dimorphilus gyrociliatus]|uniref:Uncharacterized protein n=1 Tax=Dimorphilus gyrociliatus TaxID=2664684 RepID=A0A7I8VPP0_9ANNE|nr:unnamed protein product [Dimorphilus gyrociliatus]
MEDIEMKEKCLSICKDFLGGAWLKVTMDDFVFSMITGGLSNHLYMCALPNHILPHSDNSNVPPKVLVRIYGQIIHEDPETVVIDSVVFTSLAEKGLGPKLYGVFTGGRVEQYVNSRHLYTEELAIPSISSECAKIMASFHKLNMPLVKKPKWLFETITRYLDEVLNNVSFDSEQIENTAKLERLLSLGLAKEETELKSILLQVHSPVVFCHNDMQEGNILFIENSDEPDDWKLKAIDFEYSSYNYRAYDIANHFVEWCYDYSHAEHPYYLADISKYPTKKQQYHFFRHYLAEMEDENINFDRELDNLYKEVAAFTLASHFFWGLWSIVQAHVATINFSYLDYALIRFEHYFKQKKDALMILKSDNNTCD